MPLFIGIRGMGPYSACVVYIGYKVIKQGSIAGIYLQPDVWHPAQHGLNPKPYPTPVPAHRV